eukprot:CAMPEP_0172468076 /NCGR_PEP_ID=MMETSP1065-20121228/60598_1 /TAXON_ID=265537 /ORGANISM="Amphiprora paludosa, Strain CCMP125" /LENGTH=43 /DNA_ID= /DNA_START= /DNA_END= /DNA_ORIENTATION=
MARRYGAAFVSSRCRTPGASSSCWMPRNARLPPPLFSTTSNTT